MAWRINYLRSVRKSVSRLHPQDRRRIQAFLEQRVAMLDDPRTLAKPLQGKYGELWRYRVGPYRIICEIRDSELIVLVLRVGHRREVYRG